MLEYLALFGFMVLLCMLGYALTWVYHEKVRQHVVAKHYQKAASKLWIGNWFGKTDERIEALTRRLYLVERKASNTDFSLSMHIKNNKHMQTPKKIALDKERKELAKEELHSREIRGCGDGM